MFLPFMSKRGGIERLRIGRLVGAGAIEGLASVGAMRWDQPEVRCSRLSTPRLVRLL